MMLRNRATTSHELPYCLAVLVVLISPANAFWLITADDASRKPVGAIIEEKGPVPGPAITVVLPASGVQLRSPVEFDVRFRSFGGSSIDVASVRIAYVKDPLIDLTKRVKDRLAPKGFDHAGFKFDDADVVPGTHTVRIEVRDSAGRTGVIYATFMVAR
jgi:hypothetical protein